MLRCIGKQSTIFKRSTSVTIQIAYLVTLLQDKQVISSFKKKKGSVVSVREMVSPILPNCVYRLLLAGYLMCALKWVGLFLTNQLDFLQWKARHTPNGVLVLISKGTWLAHHNLSLSVNGKHPDDIRLRLRPPSVNASMLSWCWSTFGVTNITEWNRMRVKDIVLACFHTVKAKNKYVATLNSQVTLY